MFHSSQDPRVHAALIGDEQENVLCGEALSCSQIVLNVATEDDRGWFIFLEWSTNPASGNRCYIQLTSDDGLERHELLCLAERNDANDFEGRIERDAQFNVVDDPSAKDFPYILKISGKKAALSAHSTDHGLRVKGQFGTLDFDFEVPVESEGPAFGLISSGPLRNGVRQGKAWTSLQRETASVVTAQLPGLMIPSLNIWLNKAVCSDNLQLQESWISGLTFTHYPTRMHVDGGEVSICARALRETSEANFLHLLRPRWIGWCAVTGEINGSSVDTIGLFVCPGDPLSPIDGFLGRVSSVAYRTLDRMLPVGAETTSVHALFGSREYVDLGVESFPLQCAPPILRPITTILERGGQAWRGVTLALCCQAVGGEFDASSEWLVFAEMLHTGALIVDDVQDDTAVRRGGPACHEIYGRATAINSGTLAYFMVQPIIERSNLHENQRAAIYAEYLDLLRVAHIGQGIDHQLDIEQLSDDPTDTELQDMRQQVHYCDLFKSGMPFRSYARIGGIIGDGTGIQISSLGRFFQCLGTSFQAVDDVINITGRGGDDPKRGDDLRRGKITLPILLALHSLDNAGRRRFRRALKAAKNNSPTAIEVADEICAMGVIQPCLAAAHDATDAAYRDLHNIFSSGIEMHLIREIAASTLQRHY